jgi:cyclophilin family peptidyl-prolyl cis-trans isomerase
VSTTCGDFAITLDAKRAPKTGGSFASLAKQGFYDGTTFHRIVAGFVIQGGDPKGDGTGGPGYSVVEAPPKSLQYTKGVVAMAKTQLEKPGTSGSQFFIVTGEAVQLPPEYALLGKVTAGQDVVEKIAASATDQATEQPIDAVVIKSVRVAEK